MEHRVRLLERIQGMTDPGAPLPIITLEQFFEGNIYDESIVGDFGATYNPQAMYSVIKRFREIDGIHEVYVEIKDIGHPDRWPIADTFWFVGTADPRRFLDDWPQEFWDNYLPCDYLTFPRKDGRTTEPIEIPEGMVAIGMHYYKDT